LNSSCAALLRRLPEKGIAVLRSDLAALEAECGQELRRSVYDNYKPFIEASQVGTTVFSQHLS
jgi:Vps51/Vps67